MKNITIKDIAKECGVSITAVSFVLNGKESSVSSETAKKIQEVCRLHNYQPSYIAASLKNKHTNTVGLLVPDIENGYYARIVKCFEEKIRKNGYSLLTISSGKNLEDFEFNLRRIINKCVDYCVIIPPSFVEKQPQRIKQLVEYVSKLDTPIVVLDRKVEAFKAPMVLNDDIQSGYLATSYLIANGHRRIACITGPNNVSSSIGRLEGYKKALEENNIPFDPSLVFEGDYHFESAIEIAKSTLLDNSIKAYFAFNDTMAYGLYNIATSMDINVGSDISIVGIDNNPFSDIVHPGLTSVKPNINLLCESVINFLFNDTKATGTILVEPELVERKSVKNVKA